MVVVCLTKKLIIMKKKIFNLLSLSLLIFAIISCDKNKPSENQPKGTPMTLKVNIEDVNTKTTYTADGSAINVTWDATETISVISITEEGVQTVDNFTSAGAAGRKEAIFTGTYTGPAGSNIICVYPPLTYKESGSPVFYKSDLVNDIRLLSVVIGKIYPYEVLGMKWFAKFSTQLTNNDMSNIKFSDIMTGVATLSGGNLTVTLTKHITIFKIYLTVSGALSDEIAKSISLSNNNTFSFYNEGFVWLRSYTGKWSANAPIREIVTYLGVNKAGFTIPSDKKLTIYVPFMANTNTFRNGDIFTITLTTDKGTHKFTHTFNADKELEQGKVYTINASLVKE